MAVLGRYGYKIYLDANHAEVIKKALKEIGYKGGLSGFLNRHVVGTSTALQEGSDEFKSAFVEEFTPPDGCDYK